MCTIKIMRRSRSKKIKKRWKMETSVWRFTIIQLLPLSISLRKKKWAQPCLKMSAERIWTVWLRLCTKAKTSNRVRLTRMQLLMWYSKLKNKGNKLQKLSIIISHSKESRFIKDWLQGKKGQRASKNSISLCFRALNNCSLWNWLTLSQGKTAIGNKGKLQEVF